MLILFSISLSLFFSSLSFLSLLSRYLESILSILASSFYDDAFVLNELWLSKSKDVKSVRFYCVSKAVELSFKLICYSLD